MPAVQGEGITVRVYYYNRQLVSCGALELTVFYVEATTTHNTPSTVVINDLVDDSQYIPKLSRGKLYNSPATIDLKQAHIRRNRHTRAF